MTEKQEARLIKKVNRIKQKIKELESINKENELKGLELLPVIGYMYVNEEQYR
jgi:hypothetical protein